MECTVEEYLLSEIKVEDEEFEGQELTDCNDDASGFVAESCGSNHAETTPDIPSGTRNTQSTSVKKSQPVITKCTICHFSTRYQSMDMILYKLKTHAKEAHEHITDICQVCFKMFDSCLKLRKHMCSTHGQTSFRCYYCSTKFYIEKDFLGHVSTEHNMYDIIQYNHQVNNLKILGMNGIEKKCRSKSFKCQICSCCFFTDKNLKVHMQNFHLIMSDIDMDNVNFTGPLIRKLVCGMCPSSFIEFAKLSNHYSNAHSKKLSRIRVVIQSYKHVKYVCNLCPKNKSFHPEKFRKHYLDVHDKQLDVKEFDFSDYYTVMITELSNEEGEIKFSCDCCTEFYASSVDLSTHRTKVHREWLCSHCKLRFNSMKTLNLHTEQVHFGQCKFCDFTSFNYNGIHVHVVYQHSDSFYANDLKSVYKVEESKNVVYHTCSMCNRGLSSLQNVKMHYFWFHRKYFCDYCKLTFSMSNFESEHFSSNHLTECIHCSQSFADSKELESHLKSNHLNTNYSMCEFCGGDVKNREELVEHRIRHENESKPETNHLCSECGLQFRLKRSLDDHVKIKHVKNDQLADDFCKVCNKRYKNIALHLFKTHGAEPLDRNKPGKEHKCHLCEKVFYRFHRLKKHLKCHSKYKCTQCSMQFNLMVNLEQHVSELHTNRYAYSCTVCSKIFSTESDFSLHMKFHQGSDSKADLLPVLRCELCDGFSLNRDAMQKHVKCRHIKNGKLINVKRKKPSGRPRYIKRIKK